MTDRKLLELAAKAAGIEYTISPHGNLLAHQHPGGGQMRVWNPLTDDGDALRLAAKLNLSIHVLGLKISISRHMDAGYLGGWMERTLDDAADYRRAIVRAAAETGKEYSNG